MLVGASSGFIQHLNPLSSTLASTVVALIPLALLLVLLAVFRMTAWLVVTIGAIVTIVMAITIWHAPAGPTLQVWLIGAATGIWSIDWIVFWGVVIYNVLHETGAFEGLKRWLVTQASADVRVQAILLAWALGALLEGLVGFGYPWAVIAPILVGLGVVEIDAIRVAAIGNNAPVSYGALGTPIIALATVTGVPLLTLSASVGRIVALIALLPPWILIYLVSGRRGMRGIWPLPVVGSLAYIAGQFPTSQWLGPYLPDVIGALVCFGALLLLLKYWQPAETLGFGGVPVTKEAVLAGAVPGGSASVGGGVATETRPAGGGFTGGFTGGGSAGTGPAGAGPAGGVSGDGGPPGAVPANRRNGSASPAGTLREAVPGLVSFGILVVIVVAATGPWSHMADYLFWKPEVDAVSSLSHQPVAIEWKFAPAVAGTWILVSLLVILVWLRAGWEQFKTAIKRSATQMWGALLVAPIIFGLAQVFNYSGMASTLAHGFAQVGTAFILLAPILGWIGVALSGSNTSTNALFGGFQYAVGGLLRMPLLLLPSLNSVGAEVGKPIAPQTASVGVTTTSYVRREGEVIRHNFGWTLVLLGWLILIGLFYYYVLPQAMRL
ncbi:MAG TPA: L-lactate permease [Streptosporangiaceae bacterium]|nr:L-lactate permease [Streptosporangiaceae bacterium]